MTRISTIFVASGLATIGAAVALVILADWAIGAAAAVYHLTTHNRKGWHWR